MSHFLVLLILAAAFISGFNQVIECKDFGSHDGMMHHVDAGHNNRHDTHSRNPHDRHHESGDFSCEACINCNLASTGALTNSGENPFVPPSISRFLSESYYKNPFISGWLRPPIS